MSYLTRAAALLAALADENVPTPKLKELMELYNNTVGGGASNENEAQAFIEALGIHLTSAVEHAAEMKAKQQAQADIKAAKDEAKGKIPGGVKKEKSK